MTDETFCGACGYPIYATKESACDWCRQSAERIEALTKERDEHWNSFVHWRKEADDRAEQLTAARDDAKEAEAYAEELEKELATCRMAQAVMDNTVADLEAKLTKAGEALQWCAMYGDGDVARATIAEIKGESHE